MGKPIVYCQLGHSGEHPGVGVAVSQYRTCGAGCSLVIAYCDEHGGDAKAANQMFEHVKKEHPEKIEAK